MADDPSFLSLHSEELSNWRDLPITRAFLEWIDWEVQRGKDAIVDLVYANRIEASRVKTGTLFALYNIRSAVDRPAPLPDPEEEQFIDPATRPSTLRGK